MVDGLQGIATCGGKGQGDKSVTVLEGMLMLTSCEFMNNMIQEIIHEMYSIIELQIYRSISLRT